MAGEGDRSLRSRRRRRSRSAAHGRHGTLRGGDHVPNDSARDLLPGESHGDREQRSYCAFVAAIGENDRLLQPSSRLIETKLLLAVTALTHTLDLEQGVLG